MMMKFKPAAQGATIMETVKILRRIRIWLAIFMAGLVLSGLTAFPLRAELGFVVRILNTNELRSRAETSGLLPWIERANLAVSATDAKFPFLAYGTDWLAFAHLVIAFAFVGPFLDPVRNKWVITFGLIACAGVIPLAIVAGQIRGIPIGWRLIDCCFGVFGAVPLLFCRRSIKTMEARARQRFFA